MKKMDRIMCVIVTVLALVYALVRCSRRVRYEMDDYFGGRAGFGVAFIPLVISPRAVRSAMPWADHIRNMLWNGSCRFW